MSTVGTKTAALIFLVAQVWPKSYRLPEEKLRMMDAKIPVLFPRLRERFFLVLPFLEPLVPDRPKIESSFLILKNFDV